MLPERHVCIARESVPGQPPKEHFSNVVYAELGYVVEPMEAVLSSMGVKTQLVPFYDRQPVVTANFFGTECLLV